ncbi:MAG TPA: radical SAM protein, partial [Treponemataceae bacterium]|nr:radical SAM protein [Treponemataceae bacterium]
MSDRETSGPEAGLFFIDQHGCAKNQVDAELIAARLIEMGWRIADDPARAALIVVNSCGFIESAKKESIEAVLTARAAYPGARVVLAGCLAERYADEFRDGLPEADAFFGNGDLSRVGEVVSALFPAGTAAGVPEGVPARPSVVPPQCGVCAGDRPLLFSFPRSAYVKITEGCDNRCSFCAIPLIRGGLRSRPAGEIVDEIRVLASRGVFEFNLIGQDLAAYGSGLDDDVGNLAGEGSPLSRLVRAISTLDGDFRVRLLYVHPDHFPADLVPAMAADPRFLPYFDIPFQSGDPAILRAMNRRGTDEGYRSLVDR